MWRAHDLGQWLPMYPPFPAEWQMAIRPWHHVSTSPPCHPACLPAGRDSRFSRVRLATMAFPQAAFPGSWRFKRLLAYAPRQPGLPLVSWLRHRITRFRHCVLQDRLLTTAMTESPLCLVETLPRRGRLRLPPEPALPGLLSSYGLIRQIRSLLWT
jgi:hypothetical protein